MREGEERSEKKGGRELLESGGDECVFIAWRRFGCFDAMPDAASGERGHEARYTGCGNSQEHFLSP